MARVRRSVCVAAAVCGALAVSMLFIFSRLQETGERLEKGQEVRADDEREIGKADQAQQEVKESGEQSLTAGLTDRGRSPSRRTVDMTVSIPAETWLGWSHRPRLGEVVTMTFSITSSEYVRNMEVGFDQLKGVQLVKGPRTFHSNAEKGEKKEFSIDVRFLSTPAQVGAWVTGRAVISETKTVPLWTGRSFWAVILDEQSKLLGTPEEKMGSAPEYRYDVGAGIVYPPGEYLGSGKHAREMIERLKKIEPKLSDWEAVYLHRDALRILWGGVGGTDDERVKLLLDEGWLQQHRKGEQVKENWVEDLIKRKLQEQKKSRSEEKGGLIPGQSGSGAPSGLVETHFSGRWIYKNHEYNSQQGLLTSTHDLPIRRAKVWIWAYWQGQSRRRLWPPALTDEDGNFS